MVAADLVLVSYLGGGLGVQRDLQLAAPFDDRRDIRVVPKRGAARRDKRGIEGGV